MQQVPPGHFADVPQHEHRPSDDRRQNGLYSPFAQTQPTRGVAPSKKANKNRQATALEARSIVKSLANTTSYPARIATRGTAKFDVNQG